VITFQSALMAQIYLRQHQAHPATLIIENRGFREVVVTKTEINVRIGNSQQSMFSQYLFLQARLRVLYRKAFNSPVVSLGSC
jgi:hypothetical protein